MNQDMIRAYVEKMLGEFSAAQVSQDPDGDFRVRYQDAEYFVRLVGESKPIVQVFATPVVDIDLCEDLLREINEINADVGFVRVFWVQGQVLVETEMIGASLDVTQFTHACGLVDRVADRIADRLTEQFGGVGRSTGAFGQTVDAPERIGMYL